MKCPKCGSEIWKAVIGYEEIYEVSNLGRIKSLDRVITRFSFNKNTSYISKGKIIKQSLSSSGYNMVQLSKKGASKPKTVHRLVALSFIDNINNYKQIDHINGKKLDNNIDNLMWVTNQMNTQKKVTAKLTKGNVIFIKQNLQVKNGILAKKFNVTSETIRNIKNGKTWNNILLIRDMEAQDE